MRKTSSKSVQLVLITSVLASCAQAPVENKKVDETQRVYMRADTTAPYTEVTNNYEEGRRSGGMGSSLLWFMAFRHLGGGLGYANNGLHPQSVSGTNANKATALKAQRGGFGKNNETTNKRSSYGS